MQPMGLESFQDGILTMPHRLNTPVRKPAYLNIN